jgi:hypothetical protein
MLKKLVSKITVDFKELLMSEVVQSEALINLLDKRSNLTGGCNPVGETDLARCKNKGMLPHAEEM